VRRLDLCAQRAVARRAPRGPARLSAALTPGQRRGQGRRAVVGRQPDAAGPGLATAPASPSRWSRTGPRSARRRRCGRSRRPCLPAATARAPAGPVAATSLRRSWRVAGQPGRRKGAEGGMTGASGRAVIAASLRGG